MTFPLAPWHMWGTSAALQVSSAAVGPIPRNVSSGQLSRIDYRRPENWRFCFWGRLTGGVTGAVSTTSVHALFNVYFGVGRSVLDTSKEVFGGPANFNAFCRMRWDVPTGTVPGQQNWNIKYATRVPGPPLDDSAPTVLVDIDHIVAESISCTANLVMSQGDPGVTVTAELGAFFAPNVHVRPDWLRDESSKAFLGSELGGK